MSWPSPPERTPKPPIDPSVLLLSAGALLIAAIAYRTGHLSQGKLIYFLVLIPSVIVHEVSHGALAYLYGDDTAKRAGRLTLNPLRHLDAFGTFILPGLLILTTGLAFGYAKPVPVNTARMSRNQAMLTGLVGPFTNIVLAVIAAIALHLVYPIESELLWDAVQIFGIVNVVLAVFNLIPIPPLDGSSVIERFLPSKYMSAYLQFRQYSMIILLVIVLMLPGSLSSLFDPAIEFWWGFANPQ